MALALRYIPACLVVAACTIESAWRCYRSDCSMTFSYQQQFKPVLSQMMGYGED